VASWNEYGMGSGKYIEVQTGVDFWFKTLYFCVALLAALAIFIANTTWSIKLTVVGALFLTFCFSNWRMYHQQSIGRLLIYSSDFATLISRTGQEFPGILESGSWTTRWISVVPFGRFDRWRTQRLLVCASRNKPSDYRQLIRSLRLGAGIRCRDGVLGQR